MSHEEAHPPQPQEPTPKQEVRRELTELVKMVTLFLVLFWGLKTFVVEGYEVQGPSMIPTLEDRERILVFKLPHKLSTLPVISRFIDPIQATDIVVFESNGEANKRYIKRVIARGPKPDRGNTIHAHTGDTDALDDAVKVEYSRGKVFVDDWALEEPYIQPEERESKETQDPLFLHAGEYYVLGDHRSVSKDSRSFDAVSNDQIIGEAVFRFWPLSKFGPID